MSSMLRGGCSVDKLCFGSYVQQPLIGSETADLQPDFPAGRSVVAVRFLGKAKAASSIQFVVDLPLLSYHAIAQVVVWLGSTCVVLR